MKNILYVNACVKREIESRTDRLAQAYLQKRLAAQDCRVTTVVLEELALPPLSGEGLAAREKAIRTGDFSDAAFDLARGFCAADEVVIAAPYWDMSFPALLKLYVEQLCVNKLTFCYDENGMPRGLTAIKKAVYLTTAGGYIGENNFGYGYIRGVFSGLFGISDISFFSAEGLDICGNDPEQLLTDAIGRMQRSLT